MSFLKKAVKKVFGFVKKVVSSKAFKWVAIAAAAFFTAGVAAGGFAAFTGVSSDIGRFFTAVGQTIATGAASVASGLGFKGASASLASHGGAAAIQAGLTTTAKTAAGVAISAAPPIGGQATGAIAKTGGGLLSNSKGVVPLSAKAVTRSTVAASTDLAGSQLSKAMAGMTSSGVAGGSGINPIVWQGIGTAFNAMAASKARQNQRKITGVAGGVSHGGSTDPGPQPFFVFGGKEGANANPSNPAPTQDQGTPPRQPPANTSTVAGQLAQRSAQGQRVNVDPRNADSGLFTAPNGPVAPPPGLLASRNPSQEETQNAQPRAGSGLLAQRSTNDFVSNFQNTDPTGMQSNKELLDQLIRGSILGAA